MKKRINCFECCMKSLEFEWILGKQKVTCQECEALYNITAFKNGSTKIRRADKKDYRTPYYNKLRSYDSGKTAEGGC